MFCILTAETVPEPAQELNCKIWMDGVFPACSPGWWHQTKESPLLTHSANTCGELQAPGIQRAGAAGGVQPCLALQHLPGERNLCQGPLRAYCRGDPRLCPQHPQGVVFCIDCVTEERLWKKSFVSSLLTQKAFTINHCPFPLLSQTFASVFTCQPGPCSPGWDFSLFHNEEQDLRLFLWVATKTDVTAGPGSMDGNVQ